MTTTNTQQPIQLSKILNFGRRGSMKKTKISISVLMIILLLGMSGCVNSESSNQEDLTTDLLSYAENKYNQKFEIVEFIEGKKLGDGSITHVLVLKPFENEKMIFHVKKYIGDETEYLDNYIQETIATKLTEEFDEIIGKLPGEVDFKAHLFLKKSIGNTTYNQIEEKSIGEIIQEFGVKKLLVLLSINDKGDYLESNSDVIYDIYNKTVSFNSDLLTMDICFNDGSLDFKKVVSNPIIYYGKKWDGYNGEVYGYLTINQDTLITDKQTLLLNYIKN